MEYSFHRIFQYFTGRFYEQKRFWTIFEIGAKCVHADYTVNADAMVTVKNSGFKERYYMSHLLGFYRRRLHVNFMSTCLWLF